MPIVKTAFWLAAAIVAYVYAGYPLLLAVWARAAARPAGRTKDAAPLPGVSIVVAARNERAYLSARLHNLLALDYPADRRQIIVVSDGSTDGTDQVASEFGAAVDLVVQPARGKACAVNAGVARARHEILVFTDARQTFARDAVRRLVANFEHPEVGAVSGELVLDCERPHPGIRLQPDSPPPQFSTIGDGVGLYWRYDKWLRRHESTIASTIGVSGAIYAMRRSCWRPLPADTILDDVLAPMRVVLAGKRVVFDESAVAYDRAAADARAETRRKVRTLAGNYQLLWLEPRLLVPFVNPVWLQFVSHKLGRLVVPYALIVCLVASAMLVGHGVIYTAAFVAQVAVAVLSAYGAVLDRRGSALNASAAYPSSNPAIGEVSPDRQRTKGIVNA